MQSVKAFILILILLFLSACGLSTMYGNTTYGTPNKNVQTIPPLLNQELAKIAIKKDRTQISEQLRNNLYDLFKGTQTKIEPEYFLIINIAKTVTPTYTTLTGVSGRNRIVLVAKYQLKRLRDAYPVGSGSTQVSDNYNVSTTRYANYLTEEVTSNKLTQTVAQNLRNLIVNDLIQLDKKESAL